MDLRTWQEAGSRAGAYSARHRARSPFSPLRPAPIAIGSLSTAAIAAFAFVAPGILHGSPAGTTSTILDGAPNRLAPVAPGNGGAAPGYVTVTAPATSTSDSPAAPTSTATSPAVPASSSPTPLAVRTPTMSGSPTQPSQPLPTQTQQPPPTTTTTPDQPPTAPPTTPIVPVSPVTPVTPITPTTTVTTTAKPSFNSAAAVSSALTEISSARCRQGVGPLNIDSLLTKAAKAHSQDMARTGDFSHIGSDGSDPYGRAANLGFFSLSQELIAHGKPGDDVVGALLRDPSSRRALLSFWVTTIGVSAQQDPATGEVYWTIELGWM